MKDKDKIWKPTPDTKDVKVEKDNVQLNNDEYYIQDGQIKLIKKDETTT